MYKPNVFIQLNVSAGRKRYLPKELKTADVLRELERALHKALKDSGHPDWKCTVRLVMA